MATATLLETFVANGQTAVGDQAYFASNVDGFLPTTEAGDLSPSSQRLVDLLTRYTNEQSFGAFGGFQALGRYEALPPRVTEDERRQQRELGITSATVRLQLDPEHLRFQQVADLAPTLKAMGIDGAYLSPFYQAARTNPFSPEDNPYATSDPSKVSEKLGGEEEFEAMLSAFEAVDMKVMLDLVPNHMSANGENNPWWADVQRNGQLSPYWKYFEMRPRPDGKFVIPRLGAELHEITTSSPSQLGLIAEEEHGITIRYHSSRFMLDPISYKTVLDLDNYRGSSPTLLRLREEIGRLESMQIDPSDRDSILARSAVATAIVETVKEGLRDRLTHSYIQERVSMFDPNPEHGNENRDRFHELLEAQHFILSEWWTNERGYGIFFDVKEMVKLNMQDSEVREAAFARILEDIRNHPTVFSALRLDHIDGPLNAGEIITWLHEKASEAAGKHIPIYVEKIMGDKERIPETWQGVESETGYEYMNVTNGVFIDVAGFSQINEVFADFIGRSKNLESLSGTKKREVLQRTLQSDITHLSGMLSEIAASEDTMDHISRDDLAWALMETTANLTQYRTYITTEQIGFIEDLQPILFSLAAVEADSPERKRAIQYLGDVLMLAHEDGKRRQEYLTFVMRWQQLTGPAMAKGVEDGAFPELAALKSRCDVGLAPAIVNETDPVRAFHTLNARTFENNRYAMLTASTHDTKQGIDTRLHNNVLSEPNMVTQWADRFKEWDQQAEEFYHRDFENRGNDQPDAEDRYIAYQTLMAMMPTDGNLVTTEFRHRMKEYMVKWAKESGRNISHVGHNKGKDFYENNLRFFIDGVLSSPTLLSSMIEFRRKIAVHGRMNSVAHVSLQMTSPGIPDIFQLGVLTDDSLVDPDNRRGLPQQKLVDTFTQLSQRESTEGRQTLAQEVLRDEDGDRLKLYTNWQALQFRNRHKDTLLDGEYTPLIASGKFQDNVVAFARGTSDSTVITIAPRITSAVVHDGSLAVGDAWQDAVIEVPEGAATRWRNAYTDEEFTTVQRDGRKVIRMADALRSFPAALLEPVMISSIEDTIVFAA